MYKKILVGVDGSPQSYRAAGEAGKMARIMGSDLILVIAYDPIPADLYAPSFNEAYQQMVISNRVAEAEIVLKTALEQIGEIPGEITKEILEGPPAEAILNVMETRLVDLVILGTRGLGRIASLFLGSQSLKVISQAKCPVLLVR